MISEKLGLPFDYIFLRCGVYFVATDTSGTHRFKLEAIAIFSTAKHVEGINVVGCLIYIVEGHSPSLLQLDNMIDLVVCEESSFKTIGEHVHVWYDQPLMSLKKLAKSVMYQLHQPLKTRWKFMQKNLRKFLKQLLQTE